MAGMLVHRETGRGSGLFGAHLGYGPLLQRDYWAVVDRCRLRPSEVVTLLRERFEHFSPPELAAFQREQPRPLQVGDLLSVRIFGRGKVGVQVLHTDPQSLTLGTRLHHPEAGRITFGAYRNRRGDVVLHIRSRARSSSRATYLGFLGVGEAMQTNVWADFLDHLAHTVGGGVIGWIQTEKTRCADEPVEDVARRPTFVAQGD